MKTRQSHRGRAKKPKNAENSRQGSNRTQRLPLSPPPALLRKARSLEGDKWVESQHLAVHELYSSYPLHTAHDGASHHRDGGKKTQCDCPVEVQNQQLPSAKERNLLVQEMNAEFYNTKKVIISGLPPESTNENLMGFFQEFLCTPVTRVKDGSIRVVFPTHQTATASMTILNSTVLDCHQLSASHGNPDSLLFAGNLPLTYCREDLAKLFTPHGDLLRYFVVHSPETGLNKGYGFVEYVKRESALLAKQNMSNKVVGLRSLRVDFADNGMQKCEDLQSETLFVDRLPKGFQDEEKLRAKFANYGTVNFCQIALAAGTSLSRGFAFIDMSSSHEAERAQLACNGVLFSGQEIRVSFGMPCRYGACILQHRKLTITSQPAPHISSHAPEALYQPYWGQRMMMHSRSEENLLARYTKPRPLVDSTNTRSDTCLFMRRKSLVQFGSTLFHQHSLGHSLSASDLCTHLHPPLHTMEDESDATPPYSHAPILHMTASHHTEESDTTSYGHAPILHMTTPHNMEEVDLTYSHNLSHAPSNKPHPPLQVEEDTPLYSHDQIPLQDRVSQHQLTLDIPPKVFPSAYPTPTSVSALDHTLPQPAESALDHTFHQLAESALDHTLPQPAESAPGSPESQWEEEEIPIPRPHPSLHHKVTDSLLGKRLAMPSMGSEVWGCVGGVAGWVCGEGVYDQPYIGQHQQGIPFTHPLKRIRMELCRQ